VVNEVAFMIHDSLDRFGLSAKVLLYYPWYISMARVLGYEQSY
jgi:hypothetical protein